MRRFARILSTLVALSAFTGIRDSRAADQEAATILPPFKAFAEMVVLQPVRESKNEKSKIYTLWVKDVLKGSAAYKAGLRKGMFVSQIQDMAVRGMSEEHLAEATARLRVADGEFVIRAARTLRGEAYLVFRVPLPRSRMAK